MLNLKKTLLAVASLSLASGATANDLAYNRLNFEISAKQTIANDEIHATLSKTLQARDAKGIATELNPIMNAVNTLKSRYPEVTLSTGNQNSYPNYDRNGKITGFTARASVHLKSQNSEQISQFIADLQSHLTLDDLTFGVSDDTQKRVYNQLKTQASQDFMNEAQSLAKLWGASSYRLVNANLNGSEGRYTYPVAQAMYATSDASTRSIVPQNLEVGETQMSYTISGTIELIK